MTGVNRPWRRRRVFRLSVPVFRFHIDAGGVDREAR
jgi:hypothetical protein